MMIIRYILVILLIMPFLFVIGTIASSADIISPVSVGDYNVRVKDIAAFGNALKSTVEGIFMIEIYIARRIFLCIKGAKKAIDADNFLCDIRARYNGENNG
jgi:hypothetical protein